MASGCKRTTTSSSPTDWRMLTIASEGSTVITVYNKDDSTMVKFYNGGGFFTGYHKVNVDSLSAYFTMAEKDTLFRLAKDIISNPVSNRGGCTEYVGELKLVIDYGWYKDPGSFRQSGEYNGVCKWDTLSHETRELHRILKRRIKWWANEK